MHPRGRARQFRRAYSSVSNLALGNLPAFPVIAVDDLNIAWNLLVLGEPDTLPKKKRSRNHRIAIFRSQ
jgi:hypothetical protein